MFSFISPRASTRALCAVFRRSRRRFLFSTISTNDIVRLAVLRIRSDTRGRPPRAKRSRGPSTGTGNNRAMPLGGDDDSRPANGSRSRFPRARESLYTRAHVFTTMRFAQSSFLIVCRENNTTSSATAFPIRCRSRTDAEV